MGIYESKRLFGDISMNVLCIEDQEDKYRQIESVLHQSKYISSIEWTKNCREGLISLVRNKYDLILLDMSMPLSDIEYRKECFDSFAGLSILQEIKRKRYALRVILVTGFSDFEREDRIITLDEIEDEIMEKYSEIYQGHIKYDSTSVKWQEDLLKMVIGVYENENTNSRR